MIIANFTPDPIEWMHGGVDGILKPGEIMDCPDARGKHILNKFDRRGILLLSFGDDPEVKRQEAMKIWKSFWERQVVIFNQDNERRKNTNKEYVDPTPVLREHAERLGLQLVGPWTINPTDNSEVRRLREENANLNSKIELLMGQMKQISDAMASREVPKELRDVAEKIELAKRDTESQKHQPQVADNSKLISEFSNLKSEKFAEWVMTNLERLQAPEFPTAVKSMIKEKWERLIKGDFPVPD